MRNACAAVSIPVKDKAPPFSSRFARDCTAGVSTPDKIALACFIKEGSRGSKLTAEMVVVKQVVWVELLKQSAAFLNLVLHSWVTIEELSLKEEYKKFLGSKFIKMIFVRLLESIPDDQ